METDMTPKTSICKDVTKLTPQMQVLLMKLGRKFGFVVVETLRTLERQKMLVATGKSKTLKSRHLLGCAADIMPIGGYDRWTQAEYEAAHDEWDALCMAHRDPEWVVLPEKRIPWDMGHFGIIIKKRK